APLPADAVYFGEASLSGAVRPVAQAAARLKEAAKLGFAQAFVPEAASAEAGRDPALKLAGIASLADLVGMIAPDTHPRRRGKLGMHDR
ncbi:MAG: DNA repair protein RadA, partial [Rhodoplanes sp.]